MEIHYFTAPWCAPCKKFKPIVQEAAADHGVTLGDGIDISTPEGAALATREGVQGVPTVIMRHGGQEARIAGRPVPKKKVQEMIEDLLGAS